MMKVTSETLLITTLLVGLLSTTTLVDATGYSSKKSKKSSKKSSKKYGYSSSSSSEDEVEPEDPPSPPAFVPQDGFKAGMAIDTQGVWMGHEIYNFNGTMLDYCSIARFDPRSQILTWDGIFTGVAGDELYCDSIGLDPATGGVDNPTFFQETLVLAETYTLTLDQSSCLDESMCQFDLTAEDNFPEDFEVVSKACAINLKEDITNADSFSCELAQNNLVRNTTSDEYFHMMVLTYTSYSGSYDNYTCPDAITFSADDLLNEDFNGEGAAIFIQQGSYNPGYAMENTTDIFECAI